MEIPDYLFHRQSWLSIILGILIILGSFGIFSMGQQLVFVGFMTLAFGICFISLGARNVIKLQEYTTWIISQIYNEIDKKDTTVDIDQLRKQILKVMLNDHKNKDPTYKKQLMFGFLGKNPYFIRCFGLLVESGVIENIKDDIYCIPESKLSEAKNIISQT